MKKDLSEKSFYYIIYALAYFFGARANILWGICPIAVPLLVLRLGREKMWLYTIACILGAYKNPNEIIGCLIVFILNIILNIRSVGLTKRGIPIITALICFITYINFGLEALIFSVLGTVLAFILSIERAEMGELIFLGLVLCGARNIEAIGIPISLFLPIILLPLLAGRNRDESTSAVIKATEKIRNYSKGIRSLGKSVCNLREPLDTDLRLSNSLVYKELFALADMLDKLVEDIEKRSTVNKSLGDRLKLQLKGYGISCKGVSVYEEKGRITGIDIIAPKGRPSQLRQIGNIVGKMTEIKMGQSKIQKGLISLLPETSYRITAYGVTRTKENSRVSGDSHSLMPLNGGKYMLAISDGMGSGQVAMKESCATVELFEGLLEAGFTRDEALEQINGLLLIGSQKEDIFATLDLCIVDLYTGVAEFLKTGAVTGFVASEAGVKLISGGGLPIGIVESLYPQTKSLQLKDGDTIVMVSDGVSEAAPEEVGKESWLGDIILSGLKLSPQGLCDLILNKAEKISGRKDDMTVVAAKICKP